MPAPMKSLLPYLSLTCNRFVDFVHSLYETPLPLSIEETGSTDTHMHPVNEESGKVLTTPGTPTLEHAILSPLEEAVSEEPVREEPVRETCVFSPGSKKANLKQNEAPPPETSIQNHQEIKKKRRSRKRKSNEKKGSSANRWHIWLACLLEWLPNQFPKADAGQKAKDALLILLLLLEFVHWTYGHQTCEQIFTITSKDPITLRNIPLDFTCSVKNVPPCPQKTNCSNMELCSVSDDATKVLYSPEDFGSYSGEYGKDGTLDMHLGREGCTSINNSGTEGKWQISQPESDGANHYGICIFIVLVIVIAIIFMTIKYRKNIARTFCSFLQVGDQAGRTNKEAQTCITKEMDPV
ncbi:uncharacterized protein [Ambystoma mexicanum]|uniref:uncharacterized protein isoform X2 n=1 Tax=Ambystoma mexicanum TaxID=8296 RepID=UPI0037E89CCC